SRHRSRESDVQAHRCTTRQGRDRRHPKARCADRDWIRGALNLTQRSRRDTENREPRITRISRIRLGSAPASGAGFGALAETNFVFTREIAFGEKTVIRRFIKAIPSEFIRGIRAIRGFTESENLKKFSLNPVEGIKKKRPKCVLCAHPTRKRFVP